MLEEKVGQIDLSREKDLGLPYRTINLDENECRDVHISNDINSAVPDKESNHELSDTAANRERNMSEALVQAMHEKVAALLLMSQQEERYLLERNVNAALQKKMEELQRNLLQVTNEKVKALVELAHLKQEFQQYQAKISHGIQQENSLAENGGKWLFTNDRDRDGRLRNLLKKTYLKRWIGASDLGGSEDEGQLNNEGNFSSKNSNSMDFATMKIENATLKESMESMDHLTSSIHRLHFALLKVKESVACESPGVSITEAIQEIVFEAKLLKKALGSSLPISWSAERDDTSSGGSPHNDLDNFLKGSSTEKMDSVCAAGFEMVDLLILAAQILEESSTRKGFQDGSQFSSSLLRFRSRFPLCASDAKCDGVDNHKDAARIKLCKKKKDAKHGCRLCEGIVKLCQHETEESNSIVNYSGLK